MTLTDGGEPVEAGWNDDGHGGVLALVLRADGHYRLGLRDSDEGGCLDPDAVRTFLRRVASLPSEDCADRCVMRSLLPRLLRVARRAGEAWSVSFRRGARAYIDAREALVTRSPTDAERVCRLLRNGPEPAVITRNEWHMPGSMLPWSVRGCVGADGWYLQEWTIDGRDTVLVGRFDPAQVRQVARWLRARGWDHWSAADDSPFFDRYGESTAGYVLDAVFSGAPIQIQSDLE